METQSFKVVVWEHTFQSNPSKNALSFLLTGVLDKFPVASSVSAGGKSRTCALRVMATCLLVLCSHSKRLVIIIVFCHYA